MNKSPSYQPPKTVKSAFYNVMFVSVYLLSNKSLSAYFIKRYFYFVKLLVKVGFKFDRNMKSFILKNYPFNNLNANKSL